MINTFRVVRVCRRGKHWVYQNQTAESAKEILRKCIKNHEECKVVVEGDNNDDTNWAGQNTKKQAPHMDSSHKWWWSWDKQLLGDWKV